MKPIFHPFAAHALAAAALAAALSTAAAAQDPVAGSRLTVTGNTYVFVAPPDSLNPNASLGAVIGQSGEGLRYFPAQPGTDGSDSYQLKAPSALPPKGFVVTATRDLFQGKQTVRWLQIAPVDQQTAPGIGGWVAYGDPGAPSSTLQLD